MMNRFFSPSTLSLLIATIGLSGCYHAVPVEPSQIELLSAYSRGEAPEVTDTAGRTIRVTPEREPQLRLATSRSCSFWAILNDQCATNVTVDLSQVSVDDGQVNIERPASFFESEFRVGLASSEIEEAELLLGDYVPPDFEPKFAVGVALAGPVGFVGYHVHYFPLPEIALDAAVFAAPHIGAGFAGFRLRPLRLGRLRPFVGAAVSGFAAAGHDQTGEPSSDAFSHWAARLGGDIEWGNRRGLFGVEFNLVNRFGEQDFPYAADADWLPWGGMYVAYQL